MLWSKFSLFRHHHVGITFHHGTSNDNNMQTTFLSIAQFGKLANNAQLREGRLRYLRYVPRKISSISLLNVSGKKVLIHCRHISCYYSRSKNKIIQYRLLSDRVDFSVQYQNDGTAARKVFVTYLNYRDEG